jgi:hypothetical protein
MKTFSVTSHFLLRNCLSLFSICYRGQGCQMVYFQTKKTNLGQYWRALEGTMLVYFMTSWNILRPFGIIVLYSL